MARVVFLPAADVDYADAFIWYAAQSQEVAIAFEEAVKAAIQRIAAGPINWPKTVDEHRACMVDRFPYSLIYRIHGGDALVTAVAHSSRDPNYWRNR